MRERLCAPEAERAVLRELLQGRANPSQLESLRPEDFAVPVYRRVAEAVWWCWTAHGRVDPVGVADRLRRGGAGERYVELVMDLAAGNGETYNAELCARVVVRYSQLRALERAGKRIAGMAAAAEGEVDDLVAHAQQLVLGVAGRPGISPVTLGEAIREVLDRVRRRRDGRERMSYGLRSLDRLTGGIEPGQFVMVLGRPSMGKTSLLAHIVRNVVSSGFRCLTVLLESTMQDFAMKIVCAEAGVDPRRAWDGDLAEDELDRFEAAAEMVSLWPCLLVDRGVHRVSDVALHARAAAREGGLDLIAVDYIQLLGAGRRMDSRAREVGEVARELKKLAVDLGAAVLVASQMNRASEEREDKRPTLADARESGELEQVADVVLGIYRPGYYGQNGGGAGPERCWLRLLKQRSGPAGRDIEVLFDPVTGRWADPDD